VEEADWAELAHMAEGLDGRRLRKAVVSACSLDKQTALDIGRLTLADLKKAVKQAATAAHKKGGH
jgi:hypothetical protein